MTRAILFVALLLTTTAAADNIKAPPERTDDIATALGIEHVPEGKAIMRGTEDWVNSDAVTCWGTITNKDQDRVPPYNSPYEPPLNVPRE
jgi:hypothetical protein